LDECVLKSLAKNPDERQQTMLEFKKQLIDSVKGSRIVLDEGEDGEVKPLSGDDVVIGMETVVDETGDKSREALHQLVLEAVDLSKKQEQHNKRLRQMVLVLYILLGSLVVGISYWATKAGPPADPAPFYKQEQYRWKIAEAETDMREGKFKQALDAYKLAVAMSKDFGDGTEKRTKALFGLLVCLERTGASPDLISRTRRELLNANVKHMEYIFGHDGHDLAEIIDMDAGLLQRIGSSKVAKEDAESLAKNYVADAKSDFAKKNYVKALSWLQEALEIEEQTHCNVGVAEAASAFESADHGKEHIAEIKMLLDRAIEAEKEDAARDQERQKALNQPKDTLE